MPTPPCTHDLFQQTCADIHFLFKKKKVVSLRILNFAHLQTHEIIIKKFMFVNYQKQCLFDNK